MRDKIYLGLVHYPVYNKRKDIVCTSVTNFDIHDISRSCKTYDVKEYNLIVPVEAQKQLTERIITGILAGWEQGENIIKTEKSAFTITRVKDSIEQCIADIEAKEDKRPVIITTSAHIFPNSISYKGLSEKVFSDDKPYLFLLEQDGGLFRKLWICLIRF